jgi:exodeoxyribonuclease VII small subunit
MSDPKPTLETLTFEQALGELEAIVEQLERGDVSLDKAIDAYARGMSLKTHCQARLEEARLRVEKIKVPGGDAASAAVVPFDPAEM